MLRPLPNEVFIGFRTTHANRAKLEAIAERRNLSLSQAAHLIMERLDYLFPQDELSKPTVVESEEQAS